jgi:hypothetical protein
MARNKRRSRWVAKIMNIASIKALTPEQIQVHLEIGRLNARGRHQSKKVYRRKAKHPNKEF